MTRSAFSAAPSPGKGFTFGTGPAAAVAILLVCLWSPAAAAPAAELWERWLAADQQASRQIDHSPWDALLKKYVSLSGDGINRFDYAAVTTRDKSALDDYVKRLSRIPVSEINRDEQKAFWINLYNALTVRLVLNHYPVDSIREIGGWLLRPGPWRDKLVTVEGIELSLDDIEHRILRPIWRDPLIHYGVNCAALGCPDLASRAFTAINTDKMLAAGARRYVNHPRGVKVTAEGIDVSSLYYWYREDFGKSEAGLLQHLRRFADPSLKQRLEMGMPFVDQGYDWTLNDAGR